MHDAHEELHLSDRRRHRGPHPSDAELFGRDRLPALRLAVAELAWLLGRGYASASALKLVGDRHRLRRRQRMAVLRSTCTDAQRAARLAREVKPAQLAGGGLWIDGYNALITLEAALAGGVLLQGRDGCLRDLASLHGHFKRVEETEPALGLLGDSLAGWGVAEVTILLDRPVSNSGRLAARMQDFALTRDWPWRIEVVASPDARLRKQPGVVATADSAVLDAVGPWFNLARAVVAQRVPDAWWIDLERV